jgi:hypothetical protein
MGRLVENAWMSVPALAPLQDFCSEKEQRCAQQTEVDKGKRQGQENTQMKTQLAYQAKPFAQMAWAAQQQDRNQRLNNEGKIIRHLEKGEMLRLPEIGSIRNRQA